MVGGIKFSDTFSPITKLNSIRFILSLATSFDLEIKKMDVNIVFLNRDLEEEIYMK